ncbi:MAG: DUF4249 family protein [Wenyingzhuangia sp.]|jgi:hypothetical protein|uniref:DUF4249 family protein n=1 Tax=Wenyingzhuangia sp. TaxID=1964193 RepID=UPI00321B7160
MKIYIYILLVSLCTTSCLEEIVIDELSNISPRLVIEANLNINQNSPTGKQSIKVTKTAGYYEDDNYSPVLGASILVTDKNGNSMGTFLDVNPGTSEIEDGEYTANDFDTLTVGEMYFLKVVVDGETYTAQDTYTSISEINSITQKIITFPQERIQLNINVKNEKDIDNYFLSKFQTPYRTIPAYDVTDDQQYDDSQDTNFFDIGFIDEELEAEMEVNIELYGISKEYYNYLAKILVLSQGSNGPFSTAPASIRGNLLNTTLQDNYALGYFSVNQFIKTTYEVQ